MTHNMIVYRLNDPGFTIYHRASLGGLAATVRAWNKQGVAESLDEQGVKESLVYEQPDKRWRNSERFSWKPCRGHLVLVPSNNFLEREHQAAKGIGTALVGQFRAY